jgi:hypothetical protein
MHNVYALSPNSFSTNSLCVLANGTASPHFRGFGTNPPSQGQAGWFNGARPGTSRSDRKKLSLYLGVDADGYHRDVGPDRAYHLSK